MLPIQRPGLGQQTCDIKIKIKILKFPSRQVFVLAAPVGHGRIQAYITCETSAETPTLSRHYPQNLSYTAKLEFHTKFYFGVLVEKLEYCIIGWSTVVRRIGAVTLFMDKLNVNKLPARRIGRSKKTQTKEFDQAGSEQ